MLGPKRVTRNFRRALRSFAQELLYEAGTAPQEQAAKFVGQRSRQIAILIRENLHSSKLMVLPSYNIDIVREERLQHCLVGRSHQDSLGDR